jgi:hypothetical protein
MGGVLVQISLGLIVLDLFQNLLYSQHFLIVVVVELGKRKAKARSRGLVKALVRILGFPIRDLESPRRL